MCQVKDCKNNAVGEIVTTFGNNEIVIRLCQEHQINYIEKEDVSHLHSWKSYVSVAGCACMLGLCSQSNLI